mmetsp:Transcript_3246/g.9029  ORF Transcript_3246/g.9029 Transcript_3246/m.9029 type:complete len:559 (+) Transcript_3246:229-1905(+)
MMRCNLRVWGRLYHGGLLRKRALCRPFVVGGKSPAGLRGLESAVGFGARRVVGVRAYSGSQDKKKSKTIYVCEDCGEDFAQWHGKCPSCGNWNTLKQLRVAKAPDPGLGGGAGVQAIAGMSSVAESHVSSSERSKLAWVAPEEGPKLLKDVSVKDDNEFRLRFAEEEGAEFGRVLGGGLVPGSMVLVGGDPGVGKSTLLLQIAGLLSQEGNGDKENKCVLYVSGEESTQQLALRASRLEVDSQQSGLYLYSATNLEEILACMGRLKPAAVVIDSIQTVYLAQAKGAAGSQSQIRECATALLQAAKLYSIATFVIGHVTKSRELAGPKMLEHLVDVVLYLEGERFEHHRLLRTTKNRYGATDEVGVFKMAPNGLKPVLDPSIFFAESTANGLSYPAVAITMEGTRPLLVEIQALCSEIQGGENQKYIRSANGVNYNRLFMLLAVLSKHAGIFVGGTSLFLNVTGGFKIREPAADLAVLMAIVSSYLDKKIAPGTALVGEIGLGGELRAVGQLERRVIEAQKVGFQRVVVPHSQQGAPKVEGIRVVPVKSVKDAIAAALQ